MDRVGRLRGWFLALASAGLLGPLADRAEAQRGGGGARGGGGMAGASGGLMRGGMAGPSGGVMNGGVKNYGFYGNRGGYGYYGYNPLLGYGYGGYGFGYGYPYYGDYGYGYGSGYPGYGGSGFGYASGPGTFSGTAAENALANPGGYGASGPGTAVGVGVENALGNPGGFGASGPGTFAAPYGLVGNYGPTAFAYGSPIGGFGYYGGVGGYGMGYGGYGGLGIYGGLGATIGMSPYDQFTLKDQVYAENASRYNLQNAEAVQAYSAANYYNTMANAASASMMPPQSTGIKPYYNTQNGAMRTAPSTVNNNEGGATPRRNRVPDLTRDAIMDPDGNLRWPAPAPNDGELAKGRQAVDEAVKRVVADAKTSNGRAPIRDVVDARDKLYAYGNPAMQQVHTNDQPNASGVARFLNSLDHTLLAMGEGPSAAASGSGAPTPADNAAAAAAVSKPENAPKSAGDVLRETIKDEKKNNPAPPPTP